MRRAIASAVGLILAAGTLIAPARTLASVTVSPLPPSGQVAVGSTASLGTMTFHNFWRTPSEVVTVSTVGMSGGDAADFSVSTDGCTGRALGASQSSSSCAITVAFTPSRTGRASTSIVFTYVSGASSTEVYAESISAIGGPVPELCGFGTPQVRDFGSVYIGRSTTYVPWAGTPVRNCGPTELHVWSVAISGTDASDFVLGSPTCVGAYPALSDIYNPCWVNLAFAPSSPGVKTAQLDISSDSWGAPHHVTLVGLGRAHADESVALVASANPVYIGQALTYDVTVANLGPSGDPGPMVGFWFSYHGTFLSTPPGALCAPFSWGAGMSCSLRAGAISEGTSATFTFVVRPTAAEALRAVATVAAGTADLGTENNAAILDTNALLDLAAPVVTYSGNTGTYLLDEDVAIECAATDAQSGVATSTCDAITGPAWSFGVGEHRYEASATDAVGNIGRASTSFTVVATYESLTRLAAAWVPQGGIATALQADLALAAAAEERGNLIAAARNLESFRNLVEAQAGKWIASGSAEVLIALSRAL